MRAPHGCAGPDRLAYTGKMRTSQRSCDDVAFPRWRLKAVNLVSSSLREKSSTQGQNPVLGGTKYLYLEVWDLRYEWLDDCLMNGDRDDKGEGA
jgi:hypothetical protein